MLNTKHITKDLTLRTLGLSDLHKLMFLQNSIVVQLPETRKNFVAVKTELEFADRMTNLGVMQGVFTQAAGSEQLVAYSCIALPTPQWPTADLALESHVTLPYHHSELAVLQSCVVDSDYRGQGLLKKMIANAEMICAAKGRYNVMAKLSVANTDSLKGFMSQGYSVKLAGQALNDGRKVFFLHKDILSDCDVSGLSAVKLDPASDFAQAKQLLENGYIGAGIERTTKAAHGYLLKMVCAQQRMPILNCA